MVVPFSWSCGKCFPADIRYSIGYKLRPSRRHIFLLIWSIIYTVFALNRKESVGIRFNFTYRYIDDILSINNPEFENYLGQMYPAELEIIKTRQRASLLLLTWIYSCLSGGTNHFTLFFMTNATIPITYHKLWFLFLSCNIHLILRPPMTSLSCSLYDIPWLALR